MTSRGIKSLCFYIVHTFTQTHTHTCHHSHWLLITTKAPTRSTHANHTSEKVYTQLSQYVRVRVNWSTE